MKTGTENQAGERTQHTPGPWTIMFDHPDPETAPAIGYIRAEADAGRDGLEIATIYGCNGTSYAETQRANARLIAVAPELLAALRDFG